MEGREQKHQKIAKYQAQSTWHSRWESAFRHEFVSLIYLRSNGFDKVRHTKRSTKYVPEPVSKTCASCSGEEFVNGFCTSCVTKPNWCSSCVSVTQPDGKCDMCDHDEMIQHVEKKLETAIAKAKKTKK